MSKDPDDKTEKPFAPYKVNLKDILPNAPPVEMTVMSDAMIAAEGAPIMCMTVKPFRGIEARITPDYLQEKCSLCGHDVWLSPSSQRIFALGKNKPICIACVLQAKGDAI
jgi:hypothetical protein